MRYFQHRPQTCGKHTQAVSAKRYRTAPDARAGLQQPAQPHPTMQGMPASAAHPAVQSAPPSARQVEIT